MNGRPFVMLFELIRDMILCHKRVFDIWLQTAISSVPVVDKAKKELFLRGVEYCLDLEPEEKKRILSLEARDSILSSWPFWNSPFGSLTGWYTNEGTAGVLFVQLFHPPHNWRIICRS